MAINVKKDFGTGKKSKSDLSGLVYSKIPPQATELEDYVLGAAMNDRYSLESLLEIITSEDIFYTDVNRKIFSAIQSLVETGAHVDLLTVTQELRKAGDLELIGGPYYLTKLTNEVVNGAHVESHAKIIAEKFMLREAIRISGETIAAAYDDSGDAFEIIDAAALQMGKVTAFASGDTTEHIRGVMANVMVEMDEQKNRKSFLTGVDTGFKSLNALTNGWQDEDLIIIAGRPSQGKTSIALHFSVSSLISQLSTMDGGIFIASLEMSKKQLTQRILAYVSGVDLSVIKNGSANIEQQALLNEASQKIGKLEIHIEDKAALSIKQIQARAKKVQRKLEKKGKKLLLVITDYLQLTSVIDMRKKPREQQVSESSRDAKQLAKELHVPHILLSQMNRDIDKVKRRPVLADLRESGAIEQDADVVIFLHHETDPNTHTTKNILVVAKHRNGATDDVEVKFYPANQKWTDKEENPFPEKKTFAPSIQFDYEDGRDKKIDEEAPFK